MQLGTSNPYKTIWLYTPVDLKIYYFFKICLPLVPLLLESLRHEIISITRDVLGIPTIVDRTDYGQHAAFGMGLILNLQFEFPSLDGTPYFYLLAWFQLMLWRSVDFYNDIGKKVCVFIMKTSSEVSFSDYEYVAWQRRGYLAWWHFPFWKAA